MIILTYTNYSVLYIDLIHYLNITGFCWCVDSIDNKLPISPCTLRRPRSWGSREVVDGPYASSPTALPRQFQCNLLGFVGITIRRSPGALGWNRLRWKRFKDEQIFKWKLRGNLLNRKFEDLKGHDKHTWEERVFSARNISAERSLSKDWGKRSFLKNKWSPSIWGALSKRVSEKNMC